MDVMQKIKEQIEGNDIILYMKGTPDFPQCGFSSRAAYVMDSFGVAYAHVNVLEDLEVRQNLHRYANWPTFPQLYVKGELVGGCDIILEMFDGGELKALLNKHGLLA